MSKLEQLISSLSPAGVEFLTMREIATKISDGSHNPPAASTGENLYPMISARNINNGKIDFYDARYLSESDYTIENKRTNVERGNVLITIVGAIGRVAVVESDIKMVFQRSVCVVGVKSEIVMPRFLRYVLESNSVQTYIASQASGAAQKGMYLNQIEKIIIPIPPLPIQEEIVRILDVFTTLEAELEARKKQYEYYRDVLLSFGDDVEWKKIEDTCIKVTSGGTPNTARSDYYGGNIPWLRTQEVDWIDIIDTGVKITDEGLQNSSAQWIPKNCVVVAMYGATAAKVAINKIPMTTNQACCNLQVDEKIVMYRYMFHWLSNQYIKLRKLGQGSQSNINAKTVRNFPIPVPPLSEQARIVAILDRFDALTNDITQGLPAEIAARRKQYEYYRDKLLSFKEKVS